jgi:hypothetical protein
MYHGLDIASDSPLHLELESDQPTLATKNI